MSSAFDPDASKKNRQFLGPSMRFLCDKWKFNCDFAFHGAQSPSVKFLNRVNHVNSVTDLSACPLPPNELNFLIS